VSYRLVSSEEEPKRGSSPKAGRLFRRMLVPARPLVTVLLFVLGSSSGGAAEDEVDALARLDHLLQAAAHLEKAGRTDLAAQIYLQLAAEPQADRQRLAEAKLEQIRQLEADVAQLRTPPVVGEQILVQMKVIELSLEKLRASGLGLISIRHLLDSDFASAVVDEDGQISRFLELLQGEGLVRVVAEPKRVTVNGRRATLQIGGRAGPGPRDSLHQTGQPDAKLAGMQFACTPKITDSGTLSLDLHLVRQLTTDAAKESDQDRRLPTGRSAEVATQVELRSGQTLILAAPHPPEQAQGGRGALLLVTATILKTPGSLPAP